MHNKFIQFAYAVGKSRNVSLSYGYYSNGKNQIFLQNPNDIGGVLITETEDDYEYEYFSQIPKQFSKLDISSYLVI